MINLIKNELIKLVHKKSLYILLALVFVLLFISITIEKILVNEENFDYISFYQNNLNTYDLNKKEEIILYVEDLSQMQKYELLKNYDYYSAEYYYIENDIYNVINQMNYAKYVQKSDSEYINYENQYKAMKEKLNNFDWRMDLIKEKNAYLDELSNLRESKVLNGTLTQVDQEIAVLELKVKALDYRLNLGIPYSYKEESNVVSDFLQFGTDYILMNKDESLIKDRNKLVEKRENEKKYKIIQYKLDNNLIYDEDKNNLINTIVFTCGNIDLVILLALFIISGSVIADEFNKGTIKQLLLKPFSRNKILASKIIASLLLFLAFVVVYFFINLILYSYLYNDFSVIFSGVVDYNFNTSKVIEMNFIVYCFLNFISLLPQYLLTFSVIILAGVLTTNTVATFSMGFGLYFLSGMLEIYITPKIAAYLPLYCCNFVPYLFGGLPSNEYASFGQSFIICFITLTLLLLVSFIIFKSKDIKNQ